MLSNSNLGAVASAEVTIEEKEKDHLSSEPPCLTCDYCSSNSDSIFKEEAGAVEHLSGSNDFLSNKADADYGS